MVYGKTLEFECQLDLQSHLDGKSKLVRLPLSKADFSLAGGLGNKKSVPVGHVEMVVSLNQKQNHKNKVHLAKQLADFEKSRGITGKLRSFGNVKLTVLSVKSLKTGEPYQQRCHFSSVNARYDSCDLQSVF